MNDQNFESVSVVLGEDNPQIRKALKAALYSNGFRNIQDTGNFLQLRRMVIEAELDVIITTDRLENQEIGILFQEIRNQRLGINPFLILITLLTEATADRVKMMVDCGADDVLITPVAPGQLMTRLRNLAHRRKPFVVTHDYIGPDRRIKARVDQPSAPQVDVPNILRAKASSTFDANRARRFIELTSAKVNIVKIERLVVQIGYLVDKMMPTLASDGKINLESSKDMTKLLNVADELVSRINGTKYVYAAEQVIGLKDVAQRVSAGGGPQDLQLLPKLARNIARLISQPQPA
ncbi:MAG: response regulator [Rhodospirillales bacterium]|nr:response regulator [Rhodospirillales bacterium]